MKLTKREQNTVDRAKSILGEKLAAYGGVAYTAPGIVKDYFVTRLAANESEVFSAMYLTSQHTMIACDDLFRGTIDGAAVYPRDVAKAALKHNAAAIIFAHNHPSGFAEASRADVRITKKLVDAMGLLDIRVLDHIIVARGGDTLSFAEEGLL
jgi:DNA repair protein RadC